ncbi:hypothetical protein GA0070216_108148 [Micromonospora matsumotoense]|uniref:Uncharacterized protein n=1 Tax=Micromonospora matsumotoense TaxID=121616 RepID=A0A1C4Z4F3_9ACTN|nr:hypothetical protein [Micromonospora matsumotoense]SCF27922.1 hypothetical protein GA0070216_108148 [Micromonospora matsumotoense]
MISGRSFAGWYRHRLVWVAVILLAVSAGTVVLANRADPKAEPADLQAQIVARMRTTLEQADPGQHQHAGHGTPQGAGTEKPPVICGVRVYGFEPAGATAFADVRKIYGFHLCGIAEQKRPWNVAVKLAGPLIMDMSTDPPGIQVVEATAEVRFVDRLREMFPPAYATMAQQEALGAAEMADLRRRYDTAAKS